MAPHVEHSAPDHVSDVLVVRQVATAGDSDVRRGGEVQQVERLLGVNPRDSVLADGGVVLAAISEPLSALDSGVGGGDVLFDCRFVERDVTSAKRLPDAFGVGDGRRG
ncbi:hypothetical protein [Halorussus lipolyticus]|uniref:hypothetical protein n=1 Tax=Halorussus lipolyticus TaxID=3034024 RepID=UPI0023E7FE60|nr:hypothetical protein [Halorussus sp. DT80]